MKRIMDGWDGLTVLTQSISERGLSSRSINRAFCLEEEGAKVVRE
jgi:hypothetical protein